MKKLIKYSLILGGTLLVLLVAVVIAAPYILNLDALRDWSEREASSRLGREVNIEEVRFSWAGPKIHLGGLSIAEAKDFGPEPFARFESFDLKLRLLSLLRWRLSVEDIILSGPMVRVLRDDSSSFNFDDIIERLNKSSTTETPLAAMAPEGSVLKAPPIDLLVEKIRVEDGELYIKDATIPGVARGLSWKGVSLTLKDLSFDRPIDITASLGLNRPTEDIRFEGKVGPVGKIIVPGNIPFDLELVLQPFELARLAKIIGPLPVGVSGVVSAREAVRGSIHGGIIFEAQSSLRGLNVQTNREKHAVTGFDGAITLGGKINVDARRLSLETLRLEAYQAVLEASGSMGKPGPDLTVDFDVSSNTIPLSGWDKVLPGLGSMAILEGDVTFRGKIRGVVGKDLSADLSIVSGKFEVDRGPALLERSSSTPPVPPQGTESMKPIQAPPITVAGTVSVDNGRFEKIRFTNLKASLSQKGTLFSLDNMSLDAFSGNVGGNAWADLGTLPLGYGSKFTMSDVQVNDALAAVAGMDGVLFSEVSMDIAVEGKGTELPDLEKHLTGSGSVRGGKGRLTTANLAGGGAKAASLLGIGGESGETRFEEINVSFTIKEGRVNVSDMHIAAADWSIACRGDIGLDQSLAMTSLMTLSKKATEKIPEKRRKLFPAEPDGRVQIPLRIRGTVTSPSVGLDSSAMNQAAKEEIRREIGEKTQELKEKFQKDLGEKLKKLF